MYIYRYIYTTILYMYMYIYLYHLSCEPNHVIKPIFHLSVKIRCSPVLHVTSDLRTRRLYHGIWHLRVGPRRRPGEACACEHLVQVTSRTRDVTHPWRCGEFGGGG